MDHSHRLAGGSCDKVDLLVNLFQRLLQHHHGENGGTGGHIARSGSNRIGCGHTGSCITLCRSEGNSGRKQIIQHFGTGFCQFACVFTCNQNLGQNITDIPGLVFRQLFELTQHFLIVAILRAIDGKHAGSLADTDGIDTGEHIVDIARQSSDMGDLRNMLLTVQNRLIQVGNAPALGDIEAKEGRQFLRCLSGNSVLPGSERNQQIPVLVKSQIAVHHGGNAHSLNALPVLYTCQRRL